MLCEQHVICVHVLQAASSVGLNGSSLNSTLNATHNLLLSSASAASALLSNSSLLGTTANQTANITQLAARHAAAGMPACFCMVLSSGVCIALSSGICIVLSSGVVINNKGFREARLADKYDYNLHVERCCSCPCVWSSKGVGTGEVALPGRCW